MLRISRQTAICAILLLCPAVALLPGPLWRWPLPYWVVLAGSVVTYLLALFTLHRQAKTIAGGRLSPGIILLHFGAWFSLWLLGILLLESNLLPGALQLPEYSRPRIVATLVLAAVGLLLTTGPGVPRLASSVLIGIALTATLAGHFAYGATRAHSQRVQAVEVTRVDSALYQLELTAYADVVPAAANSRRGGGLATWGQDYLLASGDGRLFVFDDESGADGLRPRQLPYEAPLNIDEFRAGAAAAFRDRPGYVMDSSTFRVTGVLVQELGNRRRLLVSHHHWDSAANCFSLRLSTLEGSPEQFQEPAALQWRTAYETVPCLQLNVMGRGVPFEGTESGGRLAAVSQDQVLLTVGDHSFDGVTRPGALAQDPDAAYGKIIRIDLGSGDAAVYTRGHRNPQGLHIAQSGEIWSTEHGPRGGDELNLIVEGRDYGWPVVTYGTEYSRWIWPPNPRQGHHDGYAPPVFAFVPSVGLTAVTAATADLFPEWSGDLFMGSLRAQTLYRAHLEDGRAVVVEPIPVGRPIRDLMFGHEGQLILWSDTTNTIVRVQPTDASDGAALAAQCRSCHELSGPEDASTALGPPLFRIINRRVATRADFAYSNALRKLGGRWTEERLDAFIANPQQFAPGTTMAYPGITDPGQRRKLIEYLGSPAFNW